MKERIYSVKTCKWFIWGMLIAGIIPLLVIAKYTHSMADDWGYSMGIRSVIYMEGIHPIMAVKALYGCIRHYWYEWQGTYSAILLFQLQPEIFFEGKYYGVATIVLTIVALFSTIYFFRSLFLNVFYAQKEIADIVSGLVLIVWFELMPDPVQGLYWWNGASYYVIFCALMLCACALLFKIQNKGKCSWGLFCLIAFLLVFIAGGNYITALLSAEILFLNCIVSFLKKGKLRFQSVAWFLIHLCAFLFSALAPGNAQRQVEYEQASPVKAIVQSFSEAYFFIEESISCYLIIALLFMIPFLWRILTDNIVIKKIPYGLCLLMAYCFFASSFTPNLYAYGEVGPGRIQNIRYWILVILCVILLLFAVLKVKMWISSMTGQMEVAQEEGKGMTRKEIAFLSVLIFMCGIFTIFHCQDDYKDRISTVSAIHSLRTGEAKAYDAEWDERIYQFAHSEEQHLVFDKIKNKPHLIYLRDITTNTESWLNQFCAQYYKKESVRVKKKKSKNK